MNDKDSRPLLQRRGGRRISTPSSPISPALPKNGDRSILASEGFDIGDAFATTETSTYPLSTDLKYPSPLYNGPVHTPTVGGDGSRKPNTVHMAITEDLDDGREAEHFRSMSSTSRTSDGRQANSLRPTYLSDMASRSSPIVGRTSEGRDRNLETPVSAARNYSTTSLSTERSASDENVPTKMSVAKKSRLNLLNPMSLLARRRSSQNAKPEEMKVNVSPLQVPAIPDFDPSIRGNFVHDFSTPRSKRSHFDNSPRRETGSSPANSRRLSELATPVAHFGNNTSPAMHSPLFKEHFQDDENTLQPGKTAYLHNAASSRKTFDAPVPASLPSFAQRLPAKIPELEKDEKSTTLPHLDIPHPDAPPPPPPVPQLAIPSPDAPPPPPPPDRTPSPNLDLLPTSLLPKHMTSVSSRFSFQIAEQASSIQEKLLEERHKEHFAKSNNKVDAEDPEDNDYDNYDFDADDDFEEQIPGVNTDFFNDEDDGFDQEGITLRNINVQSSQDYVESTVQPLQGFHFTPSSLAFSPTSTNHASEPTPRDVEGFPIGVADTKDSPLGMRGGYNQPQQINDKASPLFFEGLRISTGDEDDLSYNEANLHSEALQQAFDDMDLYFDDGEFSMDNVEPEGHFDESMLDDESSGIRDIPAENAKRYEAALERSGAGDRITAIDPNNIGISRDTSSSSDFVDTLGGNSSSYSANQEQEQSNGNFDQTSTLTEGNLAAYHDALAEAAQYAAANGKFNRQVSFGSNVSDDAEVPQIDDSHVNPTTVGLLSLNDVDSEFWDDYGTNGFEDDALDDDMMIAEANAEALENDDDGFYGQEFGFFARAHGKNSSELQNGGFFAARGSNGVKRSHSGKANFQEPSLTPITERSEWSARNSVASLPIHGVLSATGQSLPSPGINQLLDSPGFEDEMSLSALIKLRRGAFGGSSTSVNSLGDRSVPGSSPLAHVSNYSFPTHDSNHLSKPSVSSSMSILESEEEDDLEGEQLTLTQNTPRKKTTSTIASTPYSQGVHLSVTESPDASRKIQHRRNSSGADSVSYLRDADGRWVLERRRTAEDGEQEIVGREYLAGARI